MPMQAPAMPVRISDTASIRKLTTIAVAKNVAVAGLRARASLFGQPVARCVAARHLRPETDQHAGD
jgi:hypothetical protein